MPDTYADSTEDSRLEFIESAMEASEELGDNLSNDVRKTYVGTVLKKFEKRSKGTIMHTIAKIPSGGITYESPKDRINNEKLYQQIAESTDFYAPKILGEFGEYMEFERVEGTPLREYLSDAETEDISSIGEKLGYNIRSLHDKEYAITDFRISNVLVQEDNTLATVDHEYLTDDATRWDKELDILTLISSAEQLDPKTYSTFRDGFEEGYGKDVGLLTDVATVVTSPVHAKLLEHDDQRYQNAKHNAYDNLRQRAQHYLSSERV